MAEPKSYKFIDLSGTAAGGEERLTLAANIDQFGSDYGIVLTDIIPGLSGVVRAPSVWPLIPLTAIQIIITYGVGIGTPGIGELGRTSTFTVTITSGNVLAGLDYRIKGPFTITAVCYLSSLFVAADSPRAQFTLAYRTIESPQFPE